MKKLIQFFKTLFLSIYYLTPKGKEAKMYAVALQNLKEDHAKKEIPKRLLKKQIDSFLNRPNVRPLPVASKVALVNDKFGKHLKELNLMLDPTTQHLIYA